MLAPLYEYNCFKYQRYVNVGVRQRYTSASAALYSPLIESSLSISNWLQLYKILEDIYFLIAFTDALRLLLFRFCLFLSSYSRFLYFSFRLNTIKYLISFWDPDFIRKVYCILGDIHCTRIILNGSACLHASNY